jgi:hypothetical protein
MCNASAEGEEEDLVLGKRQQLPEGEEVAGLVLHGVSAFLRLQNLPARFLSLSEQAAVVLLL